MQNMFYFLFVNFKEKHSINMKLSIVVSNFSLGFKFANDDIVDFRLDLTSRISANEAEIGEILKLLEDNSKL